MISLQKDKSFKINLPKKISHDNVEIYLIGTIFNLEKLKQKNKINSVNELNILLDLYTKTNLKFIDELTGNFNMIIFDKNKETLFLIKDKLGSYPLFYTFQNRLLIFSDSLKEITKLPSIVKKINKQALANYLGYTYIYEPFTIYENIYKVPKGSILEYNFKNIKIKNYFNLANEYKNTLKNNDVDLEKTINNLVAQVGKKKSQVGVFLSSGKDSVLLAKKTQDCYLPTINTYTLSIPSQNDEAPAAKKIAKFLKTNHHTIILKENKIKDTIKSLAKIYEEPFADPSIIPTNYLINNITDKNDFYLMGEGSDAIFLANEMYKIFDLKGRLKLIFNKYFRQRKYHNFDQMAQINIVSRFRYSNNLVKIKGQVYDLPKLKNKRYRACLGDLNNTVSEKYRMKYFYPLKNINMAFYTPFYNEQLILDTFKLKTKKIYHHGHGKLIFDNILFKNIPMKYFANYQKKGFGIPLISWVQKFMLDDIKKISTKNFIAKQNLFDYNNLMNLIIDFEINKDYDRAVVLWSYYLFQLWYKENVGD